MTGGVLSTTVTVAAHSLEAPLESVTVSVTDVTPRGYGPAGDWLTVIGSSSGSIEPLLIEASAVHKLPAFTVTLRQTATGGQLITSVKSLLALHPIASVTVTVNSNSPHSAGIPCR